MPSMTVWLVSSSRVKWNEGSSCASLMRPWDIFSRSALVLGSTATLITGSGNSIRSRMIWFPWSHRVSPVVVSLRPAMATMSPVTASFTSSRELACICSRRPMRSFLPFTELYAYEPASSLPEYMRRKVSEPTKGSAMILNARPEKDSSSAGLRESFFSASFTSVPTMSGRSTGDGR